MKYKYSQSQNAVRKRIQNLPNIFEKSIRAARKRDAVGFIKTFEESIKSNSLGLEPLQPSTIKDKRRKGYPRPSTPLFASGKYAGMMRLSEKNKKWIVTPSRGVHPSGLPYVALLEIHEYGKIIKRGNAIIRIPARPSRSRAFSKYLRERKKVDANKQVWDAINKKIKENKDTYEVSYKQT